MKCIKRTRTRCECDFCGKKNWSVGHMRKHELYCTKNPNRICRVCKLVGNEQKPIDTLIATLPALTSYEDEWGNVVYADGSCDLINSALPALRDLCENCPACIMSALRQKGIHVRVVTDFDYSEEMKSLFSEINTFQHEYECRIY